MDQNEIKKFLEPWVSRRERTTVIIDFGNVIKWQTNLRWRIGMRELGNLARKLSGREFLRRFYYGSDYGPDERSEKLYEWSRAMLEKARMSGFEVITKRVKYIHSTDSVYGFEKKCDFDVDIAIDLIQERDNYDTLILFSGDGDLVRALKYLKDQYAKRSIVMSARGHIAREIIDAKSAGVVDEILYAEDFESRLNMDRFQGR